MPPTAGEFEPPLHRHPVQSCSASSLPPAKSGVRFSKRTIQSNIRSSARSYELFKFDKGLLAKKSATIASFLEQNPSEDLTTYFKHIKADSEIIEHIARFCHGLGVHMTTDNIIPLVCVSHQLKMTETHSPNNLLGKGLVFLETEIFPSWDQTIRSIRSLSQQSFEQAVNVGLFEYFLKALSGHASSNPSLLAQRTIIESNEKQINARKLFGSDHSVCGAQFEDLTSLHFRVYEPIINAMMQQEVPRDSIIASIYLYFKKHKSDRDVVEVVERLLPSDNVVPIDVLLEVYTVSLSLDASKECVTRLEFRIGKQLDCVTVKDLLVLNLGVGNLRQILKGFYGNYNANDNAGLVAVAELMEGYLIEMAKEKDLEANTFIELAEMVASTSNLGNKRCSDAIYRAVDVFLNMHNGELSELVKEEACRVLDFQKMSKTACDHAARNQRLPLRVVVQALFASQLQLRDDISKAVGQSCNNSIVEDDHREFKLADKEDGDDNEWGDEVRLIEGYHEKSCCENKDKKKGSLWMEVKRKLGCMSSTSSSYDTLHDCNCKRKKRKKVHIK